MLYSVVQQQFRIHARCRLLWQSCWDEVMNHMLLRLPINLLEASQFKREASQHGLVSRLATHRNTTTSTLHVTILSLAPGTEMPSLHSSGVEFYYVLSGVGMFSQQGVFETATISKGDAFVVDVGAMRWLSNSKGSEDLVLLRATDGGALYDRPAMNLIRWDPNRKPSAIEQFSNGLRQVHKMAKEYASVSSAS
jgi:mannose-6-phosphate isomerase-like protein (cupin superfamily)